jgi:hypothetical protein
VVASQSKLLAEDYNLSNTNADEPAEDTPKADKLNVLQVAASVFAAGLGVQSSKNRERDFKQGRFGIFIAAGITFTLLFIGTVVFVVQIVLKTSGE